MRNNIKKLYVYDAYTFELLEVVDGIYKVAEKFGYRWSKAYQYPKGFIIDGKIYATIPCDVEGYEEREQYFSPSNDYIKVSVNRKDVALKLRGTRLYVYDKDTKEFIEDYDSIADACEDMDVPISIITLRTRENPRGYVYKDALYCRIPLDEECGVNV